MTDKLASYEIDWATERNAPNREYFLLLLQPAPRTAKTPTATKAKNQRAENLYVIDSHVAGYTAHRSMGMNNMNPGVT